MRTITQGTLQAWRLAAIGAVGNPAARPFFALLVVAATLASGWAIAALPVPLALSVIGGVVGATLWLQMPVLAAYALVATIPFELSFSLGGIDGVSVRDLFIAVLAVSTLLALAGRSRRLAGLRTPFVRRVLVVWCFLVVWCTITFLLGPANSWLLSDTVHNLWFVYGDTYRALLVFPLLVIHLDRGRPIEFVLDLIVAVATGVALNGILLARSSGEVATAHFEHNNPFAGYLVLVLPLAAARAVRESRPGMRFLYLGGMLVMVRALWLAGSRGGLVAFLASMAAMAIFLPRRQVAVLMVLVLTGLVVLIAVSPHLPMLDRFLVLRDVKEVETFQWREEQWGLFLQRVAARPMLGWGSDVDESMLELDRARTAHNAFLALAVKNGIPATCAWIMLLGLALTLALRRLFSPGHGADRWFWVAFLGFLAAIVVHNLVESMLLTLVSQHLFWTLMACAALLSLPPRLPGTPVAIPSSDVRRV